MLRISLIVLAAFGISQIGSIASAAELTFSGGKLSGATGVDVDGTLYDVSFIDQGSCADFYSGCDQNSDFAFQTQASATAAANALFGQVFLNGPFGQLDGNAALTLGCTGSGQCQINIPFAIVNPSTFQAVLALNGDDLNFMDSIGVAFGAPATNFGSFGGSTLAVFSESPSEVPLPAAAWLLALPLGLARFLKRDGAKSLRA